MSKAAIASAAAAAATGPRDPLALKFKGSNKAFAPFAQVGEGAAVARLWFAVNPVATHLESGERVANLAWRLWSIHERTVVDESPRHRRSFKKLSKGVSERLDRDRGRPVQELGLPDLGPIAANGTDSAIRLTRRVELKSQTRQRTLLADGSSAEAMMHTFALDPTVGLNQRTPSASSMTTATASRRESNASSIGAGRPILTSSDQGSGGSVHSRSTGLGGDVEMASSSAGLNLTYPPLGHDDEGSSRPPSTLQRAPSIPSALRMTPNSSRRSSFARPAMQQMDDETNLPPPYPSSHPFARGHSGPAADVLPNHSLNPFQPEVYGQAAAGAVGLQSFQGQLGQQEHQADSHQAAAATLNHLWSQLATGRSNCPPTGNIDLPGSSVPGEVDSFATLGTQQLQQLVGATPASSSDASSPDHGFSPAAISNIASFSFAQRVTGHLVQQQATPAVTNPSGGSGTPLGPHRRSSNSDGMSIHGAPYRRPSLSQQSSALPSGTGSPVVISRRPSFAQRRRESMNLTGSGSGTVTPADGSGPALSLAKTNPGWTTPTGDLAAGLFGVQLASPLDDAGPRAPRRSSTLSAASPQPLKNRTFSSGSGSGGGLYARSGLLSGLTANNAEQPASAPVFFDDAPMEDVGSQLDRQQRRMSDSNVVGRAASSHSLRDQLREMQLQHRSYQQAAGYASTLESYVPPRSSSTATSSPGAGSGAGAFHPSSAGSTTTATTGFQRNEAVFPSIGGITPADPQLAQPSPFDVNGALPAGPGSREPNPSFAPPTSFGDPTLFSFAPQPNLDDIGSLFDGLLAGGGAAGSGTTLNPVAEAEHDS